MNILSAKQFFLPIKVVSVVLISSAIGLELGNIYAFITNNQIPNFLHPVLWIGRFAVTVHFIEAIIAVFYARSRKNMPIQYGIYTFFVGTVGLVELLEK